VNMSTSTKVFDQPYENLSQAQRAAAFTVLGIVDATAWERAMPRSYAGGSNEVVLVFQPIPWDRLSAQQRQDSESHLGISKTMWNTQLSTFHEDLWAVKGVGLSPKEFEPVLAILEKMSCRPLTMAQLARFLLGLGRVLTPLQGRRICETLKSGVCWETLRPIAQSHYNAHVLVASFLSDPERFLNISCFQLIIFWNDDADGCSWANARVVGSTTTRPAPMSYALALERRFRQQELRFCAGPILSGGALGLASRPDLPRHVALTILDDYVGMIVEAVDPQALNWVTVSTSSVASVPWLVLLYNI
jgi:hypothetical protein